MKILYKPFGIIAGLIGARIAKAIFGALWDRIDQDAPPQPTTEQASLSKAVDRAGARAFHYLTGIWPGETRAGG